MNDARQIGAFRDACFVRAYAKINVTLDVLKRRVDGYHDLATIMQTIDLYDTICLTAAEDDQVRLFCTTPELSTDENLAVRAVQLLRQRLAIKQGVVIEIIKRIPVAAGLGGGSSDAAAVLIALQQWWQLELPNADLLDMAETLGSDVPFFLTGGLAFCEGRGERVTKLKPYWPRSMRWLLLLKPALSDYSDGSHSRAALAAFRALHGPESEHLHNGLERSVLETYPLVAQARRHLLEVGASLVRLSGSGPTLFSSFSDLDRARQAQMKLQAQGYEVYLSQAIYPGNGEVYFL
jgi:4-diphosphocytidyl-2-C-methyl-D-erythritol kinase